ncbi:MAG: hypothetical protein J2P37_33035 [Ktedonobacteraceae bacterium]|nr:hypothetical protein [Ktedonobacteraceae bacterium]MBO0791066.1 hypothetical protein [Ktedonobacteraceae bacterium]
MLLLHAAHHVATVAPSLHTIPAVIHQVLQPLADPPAYKQLTAFVNSIMNLVRQIGLVIFIISISIAAMMRMMSFGGQQRIMFANLALTSAVIGLVVLALASIIEAIVTNFFPV